MITSDEYKQEKQEGTLLRVDWRHIVSWRWDEYSKLLGAHSLPLPPQNKSRQMAGKVSVVSWSDVIGPFYRGHPILVTTRGGAKCRYHEGRILRTKWFSSPLPLATARRAARKGSHPPTFSTSAGRDVWLNNRIDELKRAMKCMTCVSADGGASQWETSWKHEIPDTRSFGMWCSRLDILLASNGIK